MPDAHIPAKRLKEFATSVDVLPEVFELRHMMKCDPCLDGYYKRHAPQKRRRRTAKTKISSVA